MSDTSKKVLIIAPYFVPRRRVGAQRPFKFAIHLSELNWHAHVVSIKSHEGELTEREKELLSEVSRYELETPMDRTHKSGGQLNKKTTTAREKSPIPSMMDKVSAFIDRNFPIDTWLPFFYIKLNEIKKVVEQVEPDLIFSTGDPWSSHWVGYKLNKRYGLPWVVDFRDPWTLSNVNLKDRSRFSSIWDKRWERKILKKASWATFTSKKTTELYRKAYPFIEEKSSAIYNSYDSKLYNGGDQKDLPETLQKALDGSDYLNLLFWGQFRKLSPIDPILKVLLAIKDKDPNVLAQIRIHCFGNLDAQNTEKAKAAGVLSNFVIHKPIPPEKALSVLNKADILLVSTDMARIDIIPAKLWDYLAAEAPILSIAPNTEIKDILQHTGGGVQYDIHNEMDGITEMLVASAKEKLSDETISLKRKDDDGNIKAFDARHATEQLTTIFQNLLK